MEGSESEAVFESLNLKPQLFINEFLNIVDDLVDGAFDFFHQEASTALETIDTGREADLEKGVNTIRHMVQATLGKRLDAWEGYCLHHCFAVPEGFTLPNKDERVNEFAMDLDGLEDRKSDSQLDSLRKKLAKNAVELAELNRQLQALERQHIMSTHSANAVTEALKLYEQNSVHEQFEGMMKTADELRAKMEKLKAKRVEESEYRGERINVSNGDIPIPSYSKGLSNLKLEDLQRLGDEIKRS